MIGVFFSYTHADRGFAAKLASRLKSENIRVWIDEGEINLGDSLIEKIETAIKEMDFLAVILTQASVQSEWVKKEVQSALTTEIKGKKVKVIPLLLSDCDIPVFLQDKKYIDFRNENRYEQRLSELVDFLKTSSFGQMSVVTENGKEIKLEKGKTYHARIGDMYATLLEDQRGDSYVETQIGGKHIYAEHRADGTIWFYSDIGTTVLAEGGASFRPKGQREFQLFLPPDKDILDEQVRIVSETKKVICRRYKWGSWMEIHLEVVNAERFQITEFRWGGKLCLRINRDQTAAEFHYALDAK